MHTCAIFFLPALLLAQGEVIRLHDGQTLAGWEGDARVWRSEAGAIIGGRLDRTQPRNDFLVTRRSFSDFELTFQVRLRGEGFVNSGLQFRSERLPNNFEMVGYQADIGPEWWGKLYDESRRNRVLAEPPKPFTKIKEGDWNTYRIVAAGGHVRAWVNGEPGFDYTETESGITQSGRIGLQIHGGGKSQVEFKDLVLKETVRGK